MKRVAEFVKERRKEAGLTQEAFAERVGVALTVVRKIEQGKTNLNMDKVNLVLKMFGHELAAVSMKELTSSVFNFSLFKTLADSFAEVPLFQ